MKIKTSELIGPALDWAVAKCEGRDMYFDQDGEGPWFLDSDIHPDGFYTDYGCWEVCGPIIERECIAIYASGACSVLPKNPDYWVAEILDTSEILTQYGPTPLIAAMRCYIASKLGDIVDVPDEILSR